MDRALSSVDSEETDPSSDHEQPADYPPNQREAAGPAQQEQLPGREGTQQIPPDVMNLVHALFSGNDALAGSSHSQPQGNQAAFGFTTARQQSLQAQIPTGQPQLFLSAAQPAPSPVPGLGNANVNTNTDDNNAVLAELLQQYQFQTASISTQQQQPMQQQPNNAVMQSQQSNIGLQGILGLAGFQQYQPQQQPQPPPPAEAASTPHPSQQQTLQLLAQLLGFCISQLTQARQPPQPQQPQQGSPFQFPLPPGLMNILQGGSMPQQQIPQMPGFASPIAGLPVAAGGGGGGVAMAQAAAPQGAAAPAAESQEPKKRRKYRHEAFPQKLHRLMRESMAEGKSHICRFTDDGKQFQIRNTKEFETEILPRYFRHGRIDSFKRLLHMYGFRRVCGTCKL